MKNIKSIIKKRIQKFIEIDADGIRKHILSIFLKVKGATVDDIYENIKEKYKISKTATAAMIGYIYSKIRILHAYKKSYKSLTIYSLKSEYINLIETELKSV
ncbi:MAG: DUF2551 domain-containing protein [Methanosarcinaceae archaeon]|jgi:predicted transcriptional regulator|nr:DUF2551 domain-containing protein [Methanosarcinaceae archaeon]NKQ38435.1 DUF2551 domain-containing protein [Methanosarcinales archaeon]